MTLQAGQTQSFIGLCTQRIVGSDFYVKYSYVQELSFSWKILVSIASEDKPVLLADVPSLLYGGEQGYIFLVSILASIFTLLSMV